MTRVLLDRQRAGHVQGQSKKIPVFSFPVFWKCLKESAWVKDPGPRVGPRGVTPPKGQAVWFTASKHVCPGKRQPWGWTWRPQLWSWLWLGYRLTLWVTECLETDYKKKKGSPKSVVLEMAVTSCFCKGDVLSAIKLGRLRACLLRLESEVNSGPT